MGCSQTKKKGASAAHLIRCQKTNMRKHVNIREP